WVEVRIVSHANECGLGFGRRTDPPIGFLIDVEPNDTFNQRETRAEGGNDFIDPLGFVSSHLSGGHLSDHDGLFLGCKERVNFLENLSETLPATILGTPVIPIDTGPID